MTQVLEEWLAFLAAQLPQPVDQQQAPDGSTYFTGGDPAEVVVRLTRSTITVWEYAAQWDGPHTLTPRPIRVGGVRWRRMPERHAVAAVNALIDAARESRRRTFQTCSYCERSIPPEQLHDAGVCLSCAAAHPEDAD